MRWGCCMCAHDISFKSRERSEALLAEYDSTELLAAVLCALLFCGVEMLQCSKSGERRRRRDSQSSCSPPFPRVTGGTDCGGWTPAPRPGTALARLTALPEKPRLVPAPGSTRQTQLLLLLLLVHCRT